MTRQARNAMKREKGYQRASGMRENTRIHGELRIFLSWDFRPIPFNSGKEKAAASGPSLFEFGALYLIRTDDPFITNEVLYQLS